MRRVTCEFCMESVFSQQATNCDVCDSLICGDCLVRHLEEEHSDELSSDDGPEFYEFVTGKAEKLKGYEDGEESEDDSYGDNYDDEDEWDHVAGTEQEI